MRVPRERGPLSRAITAALRSGSTAALDELAVRGTPDAPELAENDDVQISLWILYQLHYDGFDGVAAEAEWDPSLIGLRQRMERPLLEELRRACAPYVEKAMAADGDLSARLFELVEQVPGAPLAQHLQRHATRNQFLDFLRQKSVYHLMESDPQSFALPRLRGRAKVALAELQYDEFGAGRPERLHQRLFADALEACEVDACPGEHVEEAAATTLLVVNVMSALALNRALVPAAMGHLAAFEATSSEPSRRIAAGAGRLGLPAAVAAYYDEHVEADAVHEQLAVREICAPLVAADPACEPEVFFGAAAYLHTEASAGHDLLTRWGVAA